MNELFVIVLYFLCDSSCDYVYYLGNVYFKFRCTWMEC